MFGQCRTEPLLCERQGYFRFNSNTSQSSSPHKGQWLRFLMCSHVNRSVEQDDTHIPRLHLGAFSITIIRMATDWLLGYRRISGGLNFFQELWFTRLKLCYWQGLPICSQLARPGPYLNYQPMCWAVETTSHVLLWVWWSCEERLVGVCVCLCVFVLLVPATQVLKGRSAWWMPKGFGWDKVWLSSRTGKKAFREKHSEKTLM